MTLRGHAASIDGWASPSACGAYDYVINGNMIAGFDLLAWPADYGRFGVMTLVVNQQGRVYQKDLGEGTAEAVEALTGYQPDAGWTEVSEEAAE